MSRKRKTQQTESMVINNRTYIDYYNRMQELCLNVFRWDNLPPSIDARFLELMLYEMGYCLYFNDEVLGNLALSCTIGGRLDVYRVPMYRRAYANNGYNKNCSNEDSVLIFNNYLRTPTSLTVELFARRMYEIERTIDVNVKAQKTPVIILASEQQRLTMEQLFMKYDGNEPFIFGDKNMDINDIKAIKTDAPFVSDRLEILKHQIWNEFLTFCGIENSNADKKERLVSDEVGGNYGNVEAQRNVMLNARKQAAVKINRMFGTDIEVKFNSELITSVNTQNVSRETILQNKLVNGGNSDE